MHVVVVGAGIRREHGHHLARRCPGDDRDQRMMDVPLPWVPACLSVGLRRAGCGVPIPVVSARYYGEVVPALAELGNRSWFPPCRRTRRVRRRRRARAFDWLSRRRADTPRWGRPVCCHRAKPGHCSRRCAPIAGPHAPGARVDGRMAAGLLGAAQGLGASDRGAGGTDSAGNHRRRLRDATIAADCGCRRWRVGNHR